MGKGKLVMVNVDYPDHHIEEELAKQAGLHFSRHTCATDAEIIAVAQDAEVLVVALQPLNAHVIASLERCRVIGRLGVGVDAIDVEAATKKGIAVINVPDYCTEEVALHACSLLLALARKLPANDRMVRNHQWSAWPALRPIRAMSDQTLGIVGLGRIGQTVARYLEPTGLKMCAYDPHVPPASSPSNVRLVSWPELLAQSDLMTIHAALTAETYHLFNRESFAQMRDGAILVNVSRGAIVSEVALVEALRSGKLAGAGLDVLEFEPPASTTPLLNFPNVLITSHLAWYSEASMIRLRRTMMQRIADYLGGRPVPSVVNTEVMRVTGKPVGS